MDGLEKTYTSLISTEEFVEIMDHPDVKTLDATMGIHGDDIFEAIDTAQHFDISDIADLDADAPNMLPPKVLFEDKVRALGIHNKDQIVIYDQKGMELAACRVWWMFRAMGHDNVAVLDGGLPKWKSEGRETYSGITPTAMHGDFKASPRPELVYSREQVETNIDKEEALILDARNMPGFLMGHIPGSKHLGFSDMIDPVTNCFKSNEELEAVFQKHKVDINQPLVSSCGSGVVACVLNMALYRLGNEKAAVYDGSWSEWSQYH